ncbi:MAG: S-adenosylmethionine decarboxylase [Leptolyngbyaceae cyanobacterium bins.349]|nr:S-adenosylmethionine decarboxylase [Leptolyngbyaceae cyanobacterium bins.349]
MTDSLPTSLLAEPLQSHHWSGILAASPATYQWTEADFVSRLKQAVNLAGLNAVNEAAFTFQPQGVSVVLLLEESHVAIHFWPEKGKITVDIHICDFHQDNKPKAEKLAHLLAQTLSDRPAQWHSLSLTDAG